MTTRAAIYLPAGEQHLDTLIRSAQAHQWEVDSLVHDWTELVALLAGGMCQIGLTWSWRDLPPDRVPRLVTLDRMPQLPGPGRRPQRIWVPR